MLVTGQTQVGLLGTGVMLASWHGGVIGWVAKTGWLSRLEVHLMLRLGHLPR